MLELIKAVSHTIFDTMNAVYHDKTFIGATFREKLVSHHRAVNEADSCLLVRRSGSKVGTPYIWHVKIQTKHTFPILREETL